MATTTPQLVLRKPAGTDLINVTTDISDNMDKIDAASRKVLGYVQTTTAQTGIGAEVDLTSLTLTVTVGTSRRIRILAVYSVYTTGAADHIVNTYIKEGATYLLFRQFLVSAVAGFGGVVILEIILTPTAASHTYKLSLGRANGATGIDIDNSATKPGFLMVEDIGVA